MTASICYLGDGTLTGAASYLAGIMLHYGLSFDHVPSHESPSAGFLTTPYSLYVVSDYPAARWDEATMQGIADRVRQGAGLLMLGGWESFFGRLGEYHRTPLAEVLPVVMEQADDRRNCAQPCLINKAAEHPILEGLPWDRPAGIGGFNAIAPKEGAEVLLTSVRFSVERNSGDYQFTRGKESPLLIVGHFGEGRTAALATDVAPHWVGGLVDWGNQRVAQAVADEGIEVGNWYAQFFFNLLVWTGKLKN